MRACAIAANCTSGASHGWMKPDFPIYNEAVAERGWFAMFAPAEIGTAGAEENHRAFETGA
jgi:dienelactone hydrolase